MQSYPCHVVYLDREIWQVIVHSPSDGTEEQTIQKVQGIIRDFCQQRNMQMDPARWLVAPSGAIVSKNILQAAARAGGGLADTYAAKEGYIDVKINKLCFDK